jgi:DNA-binding MarR family transcriptional regulator
MSKAASPTLDDAHRVRNECFCLHVQRAARALARRYDEALRPVGLTNGQFSLLMGLNRSDAATIGEVASLLAMDRTTLTANLKPLERRNLVRIVIDQTDRRSRRLILTSAGRARLAKGLPVWERLQREMAEALGVAGPDRVRADLRALA